jgi:hypothetical protein
MAVGAVGELGDHDDHQHQPGQAAAERVDHPRPHHPFAFDRISFRP